MTPGARLAAAIEALADIEARRRPAPDALKDWGLSHRFAGSGDRAAIAGLVYDALRRRASAAWVMGEGTPRAVLLGSLRLQRGLAPDAVAALCSGERHSPAPLTDEERTRLESPSLDGAPVHVAGDGPDWVMPSLARAFGDEVLPELQALARRAPTDLRANRLKGTREALAEAAPHLGLAPTPHAPDGLRLWPDENGRGPALLAEPEFLAGWFEIQDEGSQLAALLAGAQPGETVIDLCAGGGGKTLALAVSMENRGRLIATDSDPRRLAPIHARLARAGVTVAEVRTPRGRTDPVADLSAKADLVLVDAPCTGSGTWRRNPDAKWRLRPGSLAQRLAQQAAVLDRAAALVRPGGRILYVTCSVLPEENDDQVQAALGRHPGLASVAVGAVLDGAGLSRLREAVRLTAHGLQMTPRLTGTDGFYVAALKRG